MKIYCLCVFFLAFYKMMWILVRKLAGKFPISIRVLSWVEEKFNKYTEKFIPSLRIVVGYLNEKVVDGLALGIIFVIFGSLDKGAEFVSSVEELLINMHPALAILGCIAGYSYIAIAWHYPPNTNYRRFIFRVSRAWFDLVQQFFTIALGAFFPVKAFIVLNEIAERYKEKPNTTHLVIEKFWETFSESEAHFLVLAFCACILGGLWSLKDEPYPGGKAPEYTKKIFITFFAISIGLLALSLTQYKGGIIYLQAAGRSIVQSLHILF